MNSVRGRFKNGTIHFDEPIPAEWPEDMKIQVVPIGPEESNGSTDDSQPVDPADYAEWLAAMESLKPYQLNDEEYAEFQQILEDHKQWELANWDKHLRKLKDMHRE